MRPRSVTRRMAAVAAILLPGILPFNLLKCAMNAGVTLFLYKPLVTLFRRNDLVEQSHGDGTSGTATMAVIGAFLCLSAICFLLGFQGLI